MEQSPPKRTRARMNNPLKDAAQEIEQEALVVEQEDGAEDYVERQSLRQDLRAAPREEDPRTRAARRAAEIRNHNGGNMDEGTDDFHINQTDVPAGWSYEWKRKTILGQEDPAYQVALARKGWEPVPADRHPSYMPEGGRFSTIERKGMVLMERPMELTEEAREIERLRARNQVRHKEAQLNAAPDGHFGRDNKGNSLAKVSKSYEAIPVPKD